jgi:hypothetical protein
VDNVKPNFEGRGAFNSRGQGRPFSRSWKPLKCFICSEPHKVIDFPQNPKRVMVSKEGEGEVEDLLRKEVEAERERRESDVEEDLDIRKQSNPRSNPRSRLEEEENV